MRRIAGPTAGLAFHPSKQRPLAGDPGLAADARAGRARGQAGVPIDRSSSMGWKRRVQRLMKKHGIRARGSRRFRVLTTDSRHHLPVARMCSIASSTWPLPIKCGLVIYLCRDGAGLVISSTPATKTWAPIRRGSCLMGPACRRGPRSGCRDPLIQSSHCGLVDAPGYAQRSGHRGI
jgi:hypothetical protein